MRILALVTEAYGGFGGIAQYNKDIFRAMSEQPEVSEVVIVPRLLREEGVVPPAKVTQYNWAARGRTPFSVSVARLLARQRFDLVWCAHLNLMPLAWMAARPLGIPVVLMIYGIDAWTPTKRALANRMAPRAEAVASISKFTLDRFMSWSKCDERKAVILPNAVDLARFDVPDRSYDLRRRLGLIGRTVILTLGRMSTAERYKGFDEIIDIMPQLRTKIPDLVYVAAGDGDDRDRLRSKAAEMNLSDVVLFPGRISEDEKADYYRMANAFVMPSSGEGFGFVIVEAMACGTPAVASRIDGGFEAIQGGRLGLSVDPKDQSELRDAILRAVRMPRRVPKGIEYFDYPNFQDRLVQFMRRIAPGKYVTP